MTSRHKHTSSDGPSPNAVRPDPGDIDRREALRRVAMLVGGVISTSTVSAVLAGCRGGMSTGGPYTFRVLSRDQQAVTARLVDLIIPSTDTPGAREAGAHEFIDLMLADWLPEAEREGFLGGLADLEARSQAAHGSRFVDLAEPRQVELMSQLDAEAYGAVPSPQFFRSLKELTLAGYYTSEIGATQELQWLAWPGRYDADAPLSDVGRAWA